MNNLNCALFGHRMLASGYEDKLRLELNKLILRGVKTFYVGTHGDFDTLAYKLLREIKQRYADVKILLVFTSNKIFEKINGYYLTEYFPNTECISFFVEDKFYKARITETNKQMVDNSDIILCCVNLENKSSGAGKAVKYAIKHGKEIINVF